MTLSGASFEAAQVVVLSSIDWDAAWQRHQIFAARFAASGRKVFFVENTGFRNPGIMDAKRLAARFSRLVRNPAGERVRDGVDVVSPATLPPTFRGFRAANSRWLLPRLIGRMRRAGLAPAPIAVVYVPTQSTLDLLEELQPSLVVYDCASNFSEHPSVPADFAEQEERLLSRSDLVVTDSQFLYDRLSPRHHRVVRIHQGVDDSFVRARPAPAAYGSFCYYGTWGEALDPALPSALAGAGFDVSLSGYFKGPPPAFHGGVKRLPPVPREALLARLEGFDAFCLPYRLTPFHKGVIPAKLYELLALGRPTISTPLLSMREFEEHFYIAETPEDWVRIARGLGRTESPERVARRIELARQHTTTAEFRRLLGAFRDAWDSRYRD